MTSATILHEAELELWEAVAYYENKAAGLGLDFQTEIERCVQAVCEFTERWPLREDGTRRLIAHRFPFLIIYAYQNGHVWIIAFAHCKRRTGYWASRMQKQRPAESDA